MGFSLQCFMDQLMAIIQDESLDEQDRDLSLCDAIKQGYEYAKECGQIK